MNDHTQENYMPIREIHIPDDEDNRTLPSEISNLLTQNNGQGYDNNFHLGSSHRQHTHPTGVSGGTHDTSITRKAFQLASILALLSMCALLYADVVVNMNSAEDAVSDLWDIESDAPGKGDLFESTNDDQNGQPEPQHKTSFWNRLRNVDAKSAKKREKKKKKAKTQKKPKTSKQDDDDDRTEEEKEANASMNDGGIIYPNTILNQEHKLISADAIAAATSSDGSHQAYKPMDIPEAYQRCDYVIQTFEDQNVGVSHDFLKEKYVAQSVDPNVFYRATALLFWKDFGGGHWGEDQNMSINLEELVLLDEAKYEDGTPLSPMSTWTWITGDQHLSNFGGEEISRLLLRPFVLPFNELFHLAHN